MRLSKQKLIKRTVIPGHLYRYMSSNILYLCAERKLSESSMFVLELVNLETGQVRDGFHVDNLTDVTEDYYLQKEAL